MKKSEVIRKYYNQIAEAMVEQYRIVLNSHGRVQESIYVWDDGSVTVLEDVQGGNMYYSAGNNLTYVSTIEERCFDPWDYADHGAPDDMDEREEEEAEIIEWLVDEYERNIADVIDPIIEEAERDEEMEAYL